MTTTIVPIGTRVPPYGVVDGVVFKDGERYYFIRNGDDIALMPATSIEARPS